MPTPSREDLRIAFWRFDTALTQVFSLYVWKTQFLPRIVEPKPEAPYFLILKNALLTSSLVSIRSVDDFFQPSTVRRRDDDYRASDYGYTASAILTDPERARINRNVIHLSHDPVWRPEVHRDEDQQVKFDIVELGIKVVSQSLLFMDFYAGSSYLNSAIEIEHVLRARRTLTTMMLNMTVIGERKRNGSGCAY